MTKLPINLYSSFFSLLILSLLATRSIAQEVDNQSGFSYIEGSEKGPENWGDLKEEWAKCRTGKMQSPINLPYRPLQPSPPNSRITKIYNPGKAILKNRGHDIALEWQHGNSKIIINGKDYILLQCHWHSPSEHEINGKRFALELHLVHQSADNEIAVIGHVYTCGRPDPFLSKLTEKIKSISEASTEVNAGIIDPSEIDNGHWGYYYRYMGSLTTPPCSEGVIWTVNTMVLGSPLCLLLMVMLVTLFGTLTPQLRCT